MTPGSILLLALLVVGAALLFVLLGAWIEHVINRRIL